MLTLKKLNVESRFFFPRRLLWLCSRPHDSHLHLGFVSERERKLKPIERKVSRNEASIRPYWELTDLCSSCNEIACHYQR